MIRWPRDLAVAAEKFRAAKPSAHLVIDGAVAAADHARMASAFADEPRPASSPSSSAPGLFRYDRYLPAEVGRAEVLRLRAAFAFRG